MITKPSVKDLAWTASEKWSTLTGFSGGRKHSFLEKLVISSIMFTTVIHITYTNNHTKELHLTIWSFSVSTFQCRSGHQIQSRSPKLVCKRKAQQRLSLCKVCKTSNSLGDKHLPSVKVYLHTKLQKALAINSMQVTTRHSSNLIGWKYR